MSNNRWLIMGCSALLAFVTACKPALPDGVLSRGDMEAVLYDYHKAQGLAELGDSIDVRRYAYVQAVFKKHGITEADFDTSMVWYCSHATELRDIYIHLSERYAAEAAALGDGDEFAALTDNGDTLNLWHGRKFYCLQPTTVDRMVELTVKPDTTSRGGDEYLWRFDANFVQKEGMREAYAALVLRHDGDSIRSMLRTMRSDGRIELRLQAADTIALRQVSVYLYMPDVREHNSPSHLLVSNPALIRLRRH